MLWWKLIRILAHKLNVEDRTQFLPVGVGIVEGGGKAFVHVRGRIEFDFGNGTVCSFIHSDGEIASQVGRIDKDVVRTEFQTRDGIAVGSAVKHGFVAIVHIVTHHIRSISVEHIVGAEPRIIQNRGLE